MDLILACTGQFKEDGINMTMCPRNMACFGDRVENVTCAHPVLTWKSEGQAREGSDIGDEQRNHVKVEHIRSSRSR